MPKYSYGLAQGFDGTVTNIEEITVPSGEDLHDLIRTIASGTFYMPKVESIFDTPYQATSVGSFTQNGYATVTLQFDWMGAVAYKYLHDTYGQGNTTYRGKVTVNLPIDDFSYDEFNAIMFITTPTEKRYRNGKWYYGNVQAQFKIIEAT